MENFFLSRREALEKSSRKILGRKMNFFLLVHPFRLLRCASGDVLRLWMAWESNLCGVCCESQINRKALASELFILVQRPFAS